VPATGALDRRELRLDLTGAGADAFSASADRSGRIEIQAIVVTGVLMADLVQYKVF
jgi:hypothetical protein